MAMARNDFFKLASNMFNHRYNLYISPEKMEIIIGDIMDDELDGLYYDPDEPFMDTFDREVVLERVAQYYVGHSWPMNYENIDIEKFTNRLIAGIKNDQNN